MQMMEIQLVRKEILFGRESEIEIVGNFELLDGSPSSTEDIIPIRLYLRGYRNLSPTIKNNNNFDNNNFNNNNFGGNYNYNFSNDTINDDISVIYYINLELADNEDRRYFKKMEINLFRLDDEFYRQYRLKNNNGINYLFCRNNSKNNNILESSNKENNGNSSYKKYEEKVEKNEDEDILNSNIMKIRGLFK